MIAGFRLLAHSNPQHPDDVEHWEPMLTEPGLPYTGHVNRVADLSRGFVTHAFRALTGTSSHWPQIGELMGYWHDLGKFSNEFQAYLRAAGSDAHLGEVQCKVDHTSAGAQYAMAVLPQLLNAMVAYAIAGHHAGLLNGRASDGPSLMARLKKDKLPEWRENVPNERLLQIPAIDMPRITAASRPELAFQLGFATRMLFSCLVDADFLATEAFMNPEQAAERPNGYADFTDLDRHLTDYIDQRFGRPDCAVAEARTGVLAACREKAAGKPGLYSLTVPTGGGKTLSSLSFAVRHCACNALDRVIYAIPFTSIIEQNAAEFRRVFEGFTDDLDGLILEHHSNFDPEKETTHTRLASENWEAPLIVTTNVQLFESLFANRPSRCRKLHRIANSVIILDEAQTLPVTLLKPCLKSLQLLVEHYGCSVMLCTATQPAIEKNEEFPIGLPAPTPIIDDAPALYRRLKRVEVLDAGTLDCDMLAAHLAEHEQGLAIVNTRKHAASLYDALKAQTDGKGCIHLSAAMTPEHRSRKLAEIRHRLKDGQPCRVVATQLIEAGVDVDFPVVWRALAGLDSIAQAAGRCNREGRRHDAVTWIFRPKEPEYDRLFGTLQTGANAASQVISSRKHEDLLGLDAIEHYFRLQYWQHEQDWDKRAICDAFRVGDKELPLDCDFDTVAENFRFIDDSQRPIVVPWDDASQELVRELRWRHEAGRYPDRRLARRLQRQTVTVGHRLWEQARANQQIDMLCDRFAVLTAPQLYYSDELGLRLDADPLYDPMDLIQ